MPELPEVETVKRGLAPAMEGAVIKEVHLFRPDLRFPFPPSFKERLEGKRVVRLSRRAKYMVADLSSGESLIMHLGMTGKFMVLGQTTPDIYYHQVSHEGHIHLHMKVEGGEMGLADIHYADPRRFGYMDLVPTAELAASKHFAAMGPEPLSDAFTPAALRDALRGRATPIKSALLDQKVVAGLGNIYVCEALFRAKISPRRMAKTIGPTRAARLVPIIKGVLEEAIAAGGSSLRDYAAADGRMGAFQHEFQVYDREGQGCRVCNNVVSRIVQSGRSTFFCGNCQR
ncbi:MAG: bifunctional DNA-formamidopyrimidine glycosylase/DNA-(apurinic or apyrimidinic site) lyase [Pseudomonadota bacterium]